MNIGHNNLQYKKTRGKSFLPRDIQNFAVEALRSKSSDLGPPETPCILPPKNKCIGSMKNVTLFFFI